VSDKFDISYLSSYCNVAIKYDFIYDFVILSTTFHEDLPE